MKPEDFAAKEFGATVTSYFQYKGVWDMQDLYEFVASFFQRQKFRFYEKRYKYKHPSPFGSDNKHMWQAERNVEDYYKYVIDLYIHTYDAHDIEVVMKDGSKRTFTKGRLRIQFLGKVVMDYEKKWEDNVFYAHLRNFYHKYVVLRKIEAVWWDNMYYNVYLKLQSLIKERLKMESEGFEHRYFHKVR